MIKYFLFLINVAGLLFFKSFFETDPVTVSHNFPESVSIGGEYVVEIKINKNDLTGFAEFKQLLPEGFEASVIDSKKGSFSYIDREVKIIWMTIPEEAEFIVKYKITVLSPASGEVWVDGTFSFLENNQKTSINLEKKKVIISTSPDDTATTSLLHKNEPSVKVAEGYMNLPVSCTRTVNNIFKPNQILVEVEIRNDSVSGFAKLEELIPSGFVASAEEVHNAVFSFVDQKVKFLWMSFPFEKNFKVSYLLTPNESALDTSEITGFLSFTIVEESKKFTLTPSLVSLSAMKSVQTIITQENKNDDLKRDSAASATSLSSLSTDENKSQVTSIQTTEKAEPQKETMPVEEPVKQFTEEPKSGSPLGKPNVTTSIPDAQKGISFRVQICATHKPVELIYFKDNYKINEEIYAEMHEGWHKFTLNNVNTYKLARDKREELRQNEMIKGPFVTAYNGGSRITVQEALMIANQKWVR